VRLLLLLIPSILLGQAPIGGSLFTGSGTAGGVSKFNGRAGDVVPATGDYLAAQITGLTGFATLGLGLSTQVVLGNSTLATLNTAIVPETTNQYFTNARARAALSASGPISYDSSTGIFSCPTCGATITNYSTIAALTGYPSSFPPPTPTSSVIGGVKSKAAVTHFFLTGLSTTGDLSTGQPACADLSDAGPGCSGTATVHSFGASFDGGGSALSAGKTVYFTIPYACTAQAWNVVVDTGTATIDIWKIASGTAIPTISNTITASATPAISTGTAVHSTNLTGWTTSVSANDVIGINLKTVATATYANLTVQCQ